MAINPNIIINRPRLQSFMSKVLAPLPADTEQANEKAFMRELTADRQEEWHLLKMKVEAFRCWRDAASLILSRAKAKFPEQVEACRANVEETQNAYWRACDELMRVPAPKLGALRWKEETRGFLGGSPDWEAAIAADIARLGVKAG